MLTLAPWSALWDRNYFGAMLPWLGRWMANEFVRGAVTGVGLLTAGAGVRDLAITIFSRGAEPREPPAAAR